MSALRVPDAIEPLVGWRYWRFHRRRKLLASLGDVGFSWMPQAPFAAACTSGQRDPFDIRFRFVSGLVTDAHGSPDERCRCGVYAARSLEDLRGQMLTGLALSVVGEVYLWGKIIPGELGFRAQYAYPKHLYVLRRTMDGDKRAMVDALSVYGAPVDVIAYRDAAFHWRHAAAGVAKRLRGALSS